MKLSLIVFLISLIFIAAQAQKFTISGYIKDSETSESLIGASIVNLKSGAGNAANVHGFYSLTLPKDSITVAVRSVGYQPILTTFYLYKDTTIHFLLHGSVLLKEVVVNSTSADAIHESTKMSTVSIPIDQIKALPALMGEVDILKTLQLMPGIQSGNEGTTGLYVRGGGPDQNLILLDGVPIYNASHLFGFFSVFNADAINHVELVKGGFPARYGGRLSSVVDINMKEGNMNKIKGEGSIGLISAKATIEGPIEKNKTSFIVSARRTYIDLLASPIIRKQFDGARTGYYFYDFNVKLNHIINSKNRLYSSNYFGNDQAYSKSNESFNDDDSQVEEKKNFELKWGNIINAFRWNHVFNPRLFSNTTATFSRYHFDISQDYQEKRSTPAQPDEELYYGNQYQSTIRDFSAKIDFDYLPNPDHLIRFGISNIAHKFSPGVYSYQSSVEGDTTAGARITNAYEGSAYVEDDWEINDFIKVNVGLHASTFAVENKWYRSIQPRISSRFLLTEDLSLKASYSKMTQFIHLLTNAGLGLPTDLWVPSTSRIKPQQSNQVALGLAKTYNSSYEISVEAYYKTMTHLIEYKDGASYLNIDGDWQDKVVTNGKGKSYGTELLIQKKTGFITGWIGYTLSKTTRQFTDLNFGKEFPYKYDRRHDVSVALNHEGKKNMDVSLVWVFGTGNAITLPIATYQEAPTSFNTYDQSVGLTYYGDRNSFRMKSYHRLDLNVSWRKQKKWGERTWSVGVYNAYSRLNPFYISLERDRNFKPQFRQYSLFPIIPSITYRFKF